MCDNGDADRIFAILPACAAEVQTELATSLMNRMELPVSQARTALDHPDAATVRLAAHILGRTAATDAGPEIEKTLKKWQTTWVERRQQMRRANLASDIELARIASCLRMLLWGAQRVGIPADTLRPLVEFGVDDAWYRPIRLAALSAMAYAANPSKAVLATLEAAAIGNDAEARTLAVDALARLGPKQAAALADKILADRVSFHRLANSPIQAHLQSAASQQHYQSVALPHLIARRDLDTLAAVAANAKLPDATRLGAIEGLAALAEEAAESNLIELGNQASASEELRKAAWRGVRRSRRARTPPAPSGRGAGGDGQSV